MNEHGTHTTTGTNGLAVASMVVGISGLVLALVLPIFALLGVVAVIFGHVALHQLKQVAVGGKGLAVAGLSTGYVGVGAAVVLALVVAANA